MPLLSRRRRVFPGAEAKLAPAERDSAKNPDGRLARPRQKDASKNAPAPRRGLYCRHNAISKFAKHSLKSKFLTPAEPWPEQAVLSTRDFFHVFCSVWLHEFFLNATPVLSNSFVLAFWLFFYLFPQKTPPPLNAGHVTTLSSQELCGMVGFPAMLFFSKLFFLNHLKDR